MLRLVLMRHAKASDDTGKLADHDRPLRARGRRDAARVGQYLARHEHIDEVLCSSATRAKETWTHAKTAWESPPPVQFLPELYLPNLKGLVAALKNAKPESRSLLVIGHSPSLDAFVLTHAGRANTKVLERAAQKLPTGSIAVMEFRDGAPSASGPSRGKLASLTAPSDLTPDESTPDGKPEKSKYVPLDKRTTVAELASIAIGGAIGQARANAQVEAVAAEPELVHQQRVGVRRLRVYLRLFEKQVGKARATRLSTELRWLFRALSDVRDRDVLEESTLRRLTRRVEDNALERLRKEVHESRVHSHEHLEKVLHSRRYASLVRDLSELAADLAHEEAHGKKRGRKWLAKRLSRRAGRVLGLTHELDTSDDRAVHGLRKQIKKLRYAAELARGAFDEDDTTGYLECVEQLQDVLGEWNDRAVAKALLEQSFSGKTKNRRARAWREIEAQLEADRGELASQMETALEALKKAEPFWA